MRDSVLAYVVAGVGVLATAGVGLALYVLLVSPALESAQKNARRIDTKKAQLARAQKQLADWTQEAEDLELDAARARQAIDRLKLKQRQAPNPKTDTESAARLLPQRALKGIPSQLRTLARDLQVGVKTVERLDPIADGRIHFEVFRVVASGSYVHLIEWLERVALHDGRLCEPHTFRLGRQASIASMFARPAPRRQVRLELDATVHCAGMGDRGDLPAAHRVRPYPQNGPWTALRGPYWAHRAQRARRSPFTPHLYRFYEAPDLPPLPPDPPSEADESTDVVADAPDGTVAAPPSPKTDTDPPASPLTSAPLERYTVLAIVRRGDLDTALVMMPNGGAKAVTVDSRIGSEGGIVTEIRKDALVVDIPTKADPVIIPVSE